MTLGTMIRAARVADGLTQRELAEVVGDMTSGNDISRWECDANRPRTVRMGRLIAILGLNEAEAWREWREHARRGARP